LIAASRTRFMIKQLKYVSIALRIAGGGETIDDIVMSMKHLTK